MQCASWSLVRGDTRARKRARCSEARDAWHERVTARGTEESGLVRKLLKLRWLDVAVRAGKRRCHLSALVVRTRGGKGPRTESGNGDAAVGATARRRFADQDAEA
jgi:hypothetical protein